MLTHHGIYIQPISRLSAQLPKKLHRGSDFTAVHYLLSPCIVRMRQSPAVSHNLFLVMPTHPRTAS